MAKIVIATQAGVPSAQLVKDLRGLVDGGVARIAATLLGGEALFEDDLFDRPPLKSGTPTIQKTPTYRWPLLGRVSPL